MELVGNYISLEITEDRILMDFYCTNKEIFREILVPPALQKIPKGLIRIWTNPLLDECEAPTKQQVLVHWEALDE